ncbi:DUF1003 domain-containing protein [Chitinophagaceae bacterium MMS25-I14]
MERTCIVNGTKYPESEGLLWKDLRPSVKEFMKGVKTIKQSQADDSFISFYAFNNLMKAYVASVAEEEIKEHERLRRDVQMQYASDDTLQPLHLTDDQDSSNLTFGQRLADKIADFGGSWPFIIIFLVFLVCWMLFNSFVLRSKAYDAYPYILLNLILSCLAALQAPVIMMSQNRQETKDRQHAEYDFQVNRKAETEIRLLHEKLDHLLFHQHQHMVEMMQIQLDLISQLHSHRNADTTAKSQPENPSGDQPSDTSSR